jgi:hypothetical protein
MMNACCYRMAKGYPFWQGKKRFCFRYNVHAQGCAIFADTELVIGVVPVVFLQTLICTPTLVSASGYTGSTCFGPPGSGSISQRCGSRSGSFYHHSIIKLKKFSKTVILTVL